MKSGISYLRILFLTAAVGLGSHKGGVADEYDIVNVESIRQAITDPKTFWYDERSLPSVIQSDGSLFRKGYNLAGRLDPTGSPNNESPWQNTGGLDQCEDVFVKRFCWLPDGEKVRIWREKYVAAPRSRHLPTVLWRGEYPEGTVVGELLRDGERLFEVRARVKGSSYGEWETYLFESGIKPRGYKAVNNCIDCHKDIGRHALDLDPKRDWYGPVNGLEPNGPIHLHFFDYNRVYARDVSTPVSFNKKLAGMYHVLTPMPSDLRGRLRR